MVGAAMVGWPWLVLPNIISSQFRCYTTGSCSQHHHGVQHLLYAIELYLGEQGWHALCRYGHGWCFQIICSCS
ncbi:hypothetical protein COO60DRAFT_25035 [Scenedesmus sp. NREL 46B-D3]|nr:hypothetical protein COO60DRAFT_25035 [Scenedesmus sp. NREL 46B-D3]